MANCCVNTATQTSETPQKVQQPSLPMELVKYSLAAVVVVVGIYAFGYIYTRGAIAAGGVKEVAN